MKISPRAGKPAEASMLVNVPRLSPSPTIRTCLGGDNGRNGNGNHFILLFVVATAVAIAVQRLAVPYTVALVFTGLVLGLVHAFEAPHLTKALLFSVFLPGLLFEAAFHIEFKQFWRNRLAIYSLALPGVVAAIALTAVILTPVAN